MQSPASSNSSLIGSTATLEKSLILNKKRNKLKHSIKWGSVNVLLLSIVLYDIIHTCPFHISYFYYAECCAAIILSLNLGFYLFRYIFTYLTLETLPITPLQKKLLGVKDSDPNYKIIENNTSNLNSATKNTTNSSPNTSNTSNLASPKIVSTPNYLAGSSFTNLSNTSNLFNTSNFANISNFANTSNFDNTSNFSNPTNFVNTSNVSNSPNFGLPSNFASSPNFAPSSNFASSPNYAQASNYATPSNLLNTQKGGFPPTPMNLPSTPMNTTALSWFSNLSNSSQRNDSTNFSISSPSWVYMQGSPANSPAKSPDSKSKPRDVLGFDEIKDVETLKQYLKEYEESEKAANINPTPDKSSFLCSFWNSPADKISSDSSPFLRRVQYQLSTQGTTSSSPKTDDKGSPLTQNLKGMETWHRLNIDLIALTQWNENLRLWISQTILDRLVKEIATIDDALQQHGFTDIKIGQIGLDRLRKTAQMIPVIQYIPTFSALIPFLELTPNQEYLVKRIRELSKGGCMSEFKWNGGSSFNGKEWDNSLPTDSAIVMHLFASYLDSQLMPLPNKPDAKPFTSSHYIKYSEKITDLSEYSLAIQQVSEYPPHFRVIVGNEIYEMVKGYNNLFHSILLFLYHVNKNEHGMLGRVNLGKSGINMLWIINS